jgi:membrane associated rhomboid family serine protease
MAPRNSSDIYEVHTPRIELPTSQNERSRRDSNEALIQAEDSLKPLLMPSPSAASPRSATVSPRLLFSPIRSPTVEFEFPSFKPYVIRALIVLNVVVFIIEMIVAGFQFAPLSQNLTMGPTPHILKQMGAKDTYRIQEHHEIWRLFVPMFLHAGILHLCLNMLALRNVGESLEMEYGHLKIAVIYLISGLTSSLNSAVFLPRQIGVGASGAIYGLVGACSADLMYSWSYTENRIQLFVSLLLSLVVGLGLGLLPLMDNFAHIGGLIGGFLLSVILLGHKGLEVLQPKRTQKLRFIARIISGVVLVGFLIFLIVTLFSGTDGNELCPWCRYASCVNTPWWTCEPIRCVETLTDGTVREIDWKYCDDLI